MASAARDGTREGQTRREAVPGQGTRVNSTAGEGERGGVSNGSQISGPEYQPE